MEPRKCLHCNKEFVTGPAHKKFCSSNCKQRNKYNRKVRGNRERLREYYNNLYIKKVGGLSRQSKFACDPEITKEKGRIRQRRRYKEDPSYVLLHCSLRRSQKIKAFPKWDNELTLFVLKEAYSLAKQRKTLTGISWDVDHIVPLRGKDVCGLHVWNNLQVIPSILNRVKGNRFVYTYSWKEFYSN